jgi:hypothetical protein
MTRSKVGSKIDSSCNKIHIIYIIYIIHNIHKIYILRTVLSAFNSESPHLIVHFL